MRTLTILALGVLAVGGCAAKPAAPGVASLSRAATPAASTSAAAEHGPQARLDTTNAELLQWDRTYWKCLSAHGAATSETTRQKDPYFVDAHKAPAAALQACVSKKPNGLPPEMDPAENPDYAAEWHANVKCLQAKGMPIIETADGWTWNSSHAVVPKNEEQLEIACQVQSFTKH